MKELLSNSYLNGHALGLKVLLSSFHSNGHTLEFKLESP